MRQSNDRNFDDLADKFTRNIYATHKGQIRQAILWQDLQHALTILPSRPLHILDAGGGTGVMACQLAKLGHHITLCDISEKMLHLAKLKAKEAGVAENITFLHCSAQEVGKYLSQPVDLLLFHAVLEWVTDPQTVLTILQRYLTECGILSLMFYNYNGLLFRTMQLGNFAYIDAGMHKKKRRTLSPNNPLHPEQVYAWLADMEMPILVKSGVRVFNDYLRDVPQDLATLVQLEQRFCRQEPYLSLGRYIHLLAQRVNHHPKRKCDE